MTGNARDPAKKLVLFHRDFQRFTGGHLKVWDYFNHVAASPAFEPRIAFTPDSKWDTTNPWSAVRERIVDWKPNDADVLFLAGIDWRALTDEQRNTPERPIINLIQHQRHADHRSELRGFLKHQAVRICVSEEVATAIRETGIVKGPVFVIPNSIDFSGIPQGKPWIDRKIDILVLGLKMPDLSRDVMKGVPAAGLNIRCVADFLPRPEFLELLGEAKITVFLPRPVEGFYLPALEGMAAGTIVVCPDCEGNRSFCVDGSNCYRPKHNLHAIVAAIRLAISQQESARTRMLERAKATVLDHSIMQEREKFLRILTQIEL